MVNEPDRFHRHSVRMKGYDYSQPGAYFVTVVTFQRACHFGEVIDGEMRLNEFGAIARAEWFRTAIQRSNVRLNPDEFVVMPNHIHGLIWIIETDSGRGAATLRPYEQPDVQNRHIYPNSLGAIVRAYKSAVTNRINIIRNTRGSPVWQRNYYEHIVRDELDLGNIAVYISANPETWKNDPEYSSLSII